MTRWGARTLSSSAQYLAAAPGPARDAMLVEYLQGPAADTYVWLFSRIEDQHENKLGEMEQVRARACFHSRRAHVTSGVSRAESR